MKSLFFLVGGMEQYADNYGYHEHFFETHGAFLSAFIIAAVVAVIFAAIYYFGLCMSHKTISCATMPVWAVALILSGVVSFLIAGQILIGHDNPDGTSKITYDHSFYKDLDDYYIELAEEAPDAEKETMNGEKNDIIAALEDGEDVALMFNLNTGLWSLLAFYLISLLMKGFSTNGMAIPHLWPHGRKERKSK